MSLAAATENEEFVEELNWNESSVVDLAALCSLAVRVEPHLLRLLRCSFLPSADASLEADLAFSDLAELGMGGVIALQPHLLPALRKRLRADGDPQRAGWLDRAHKVIKRAHNGLSPAIKLEEEAIYLAIRQPNEHWKDDVSRLLGEAAKAIVVDHRRDLARWAERALRELPSAVRETAGFWALASAADRRTGIPLGLGRAPSDAIAKLSEVLSELDFPTIDLGVSRRGENLLLSVPPDDADFVFGAPDTTPVPLEITSSSTSVATRSMTLARNQSNTCLTVEAVGRGSITIKTLDGSLYEIASLPEPSAGSENAQRRAEIHERRRIFDDFWKVDEVIVSHERFDGTMSSKERRLVFDRGDTVAIVLYNIDTQSVIVVEQFKAPVLAGRRHENPSTMYGWIVETVAGMIDRSETPEEAIIRETMEETGYRIQAPRLIGKFFSSPSGTSERIFLYFAEVSEADRNARGGGLPREDMAVVIIPIIELFDRLAKKLIDDPKLVFAAYWLQDHIRRAPPLEPRTYKFALAGKPQLIIGYKTGSLEEVRGVSVWVNPENTDMMMDRFIGRTISARIRYLGAHREGDAVLEDTIQQSLRSAVGERGHVRLGTVLVTESGMLLVSHEVEQIFHVATVEGGPGAGVKADLETIKVCVDRVLKRVEEENRRWSRLLRRKFLRSIIFPMIGAGDGGLTPEAVAQNIIPVAINYYRNTPDPTLNEIYFLAFKTREKTACDRVLESYCRNGELMRVGEQ